MATNKYSFKLKSELSELKTLFQHINSFGQFIGLSETLISEINICLDELFTNIVLYGFEDNQKHLILFDISIHGHALIFNITDDGIPFNPLAKNSSELASDINEAKIGGLGIHIVKKLMDEIWYERKQSKNILRLKKNIPAVSHLCEREKVGKRTRAADIHTFVMDS